MVPVQGPDHSVPRISDGWWIKKGKRGRQYKCVGSFGYGCDDDKTGYYSKIARWRRGVQGKWGKM